MPRKKYVYTAKRRAAWDKANRVKNSIWELGREEYYEEHPKKK
jgi:hypothetical protein